MRGVWRRYRIFQECFYDNLSSFNECDSILPLILGELLLHRMASTMDSYDPLAVPYMHSPMPFAAGNMQNLDYMPVPSVMDLQEQYSNFDSEPYMRYAIVVNCIGQELTNP